MLDKTYCINCGSIREYNKLMQFLAQTFGGGVKWQGEISDGPDKIPHFEDCDFPMFVYIEDNILAWSPYLFAEERYTVDSFMKEIICNLE